MYKGYLVLSLCIIGFSASIFVWKRFDYYVEWCETNNKDVINPLVGLSLSALGIIVSIIYIATH